MDDNDYPPEYLCIPSSTEIQQEMDSELEILKIGFSIKLFKIKFNFSIHFSKI
jgi:hypothetical protein